MRAFEFRGGFDLESLTLVERPAPTPGPFEVLVRVRAASLNYRDWAITRGSYDPGAKPPLVPLSDAVGEVVALGSGVTRVAVGERVCPTYLQDWIAGEPSPAILARKLGGPLDGVLAEYITIPEHGLVRAPQRLSDVEAATLPVAGVTAWHALFIAGRVKPGDTVLVEGTGGVSLFALQLARLGGAQVIVTSSSEEKLARARALGASFTIHYRQTPRWDERVLEITAGRGVDHVIEVVGGDNLGRAIAATRVGGEISLLGFLDKSAAPFDVMAAIRRNIHLRTFSVGSRASFASLVRAVEASEFRPVVDRVFAFEEAKEALVRLGRGQHFGKIAIAFPS